ncbi:hypothetical protein BH10BAC4_BH10BAC4_08460 [soil metagenome]
MKRFYVFFLFIGLTSSLGAQPSSPKIGLTLTGEGATGLAHTGILKAIDSGRPHFVIKQSIVDA